MQHHQHPQQLAAKRDVGAGDDFIEHNHNSNIIKHHRHADGIKHAPHHMLRAVGQQYARNQNHGYENQQSFQRCFHAP